MKGWKDEGNAVQRALISEEMQVVGWEMKEPTKSVTIQLIFVRLPILYYYGSTSSGVVGDIG